MNDFTHEMALAPAERLPDAPALVDSEGLAVSFATLRTRVHQLAWWLRLQGVGPERIVGVQLPRSPALPVALLAVLTAGGAYLPLEPDTLSARRDFMLADAGADLVLTPELLSAHRTEIESQPALRPSVALDPRNLAYVIYTSGSTGVPKGVMVEHRQLAAYLRWAGAAYCNEAGRGAPLHTPAIFDLSVTTLFAPLFAAQPLNLLTTCQPPTIALPDALCEGGFSFVKLTPAHLGLLADTLPDSAFAAATARIVVGGEALSYGHIRPWAENAPGVQIVNEYGPTEATVACCIFETRAGAPGTGPVPIGKATPGTRLVVADDRLRPVGVGGVGELLIGGVQVTRGYLGRPDLTAERFLPDPQQPGARMYRTGDLVRVGAQGHLTYLGRRDDQVKLHGYRIELAEIEAVLTAHPEVVQAAACLRGAGSRRSIAAYLVTQRHHPGQASEILAHVARHLPGYMVPATVTFLDHLPLSGSGKVDRSALPEPAPRRLARSRKASR